MQSATRPTRTYLICMIIFWLVFGLITAFYPRLMDLFQTVEGVEAKTAFSNHVWLHDGLDIFAICILLFSLWQQPTLSRNQVLSAALASLMPAVGIIYSLIATPYWNPLFIAAGLACLAFVIWGVVLSRRYNTVTSSI